MEIPVGGHSQRAVLPLVSVAGNTPDPSNHVCRCLKSRDKSHLLASGTSIVFTPMIHKLRIADHQASAKG